MSYTNLQISCSISPTDPLAQLGFEIRLDNQVIFLTTQVLGLTKFECSIPDDEAEHCLEFVLKNKTDKDTSIDESGNIIKDACIIVSDLTFDKVELKQIFIDKAIYTHNFNGTQSEVKEKFYGTMGCNGTVQLNFTTPVYLWLLENM